MTISDKVLWYYGSISWMTGRPYSLRGLQILSLETRENNTPSRTFGPKPRDHGAHPGQPTHAGARTTTQAVVYHRVRTNASYQCYIFEQEDVL